MSYIEVVYEEEDKSRGTLSSGIPIGTVFTGVVGDTKALFVKTATGILQLSDPHNMWTAEDVLVVNFKEVSICITILPY